MNTQLMTMKVEYWYERIKLAMMCITMTSAFVFIVSQMWYGGLVWAGVIATPILVIYHIVARFTGIGSSVLFFVIFVFMTFSMSGFHIKNQKLGKWFSYHPTMCEKYSVDIHNSNAEIAVSMHNRLREAWFDSNEYTIYSANKVGSGPYDMTCPVSLADAFEAAYEEFAQWVVDDKSGDAPVPTPEYMLTFLNRRSLQENARLWPYGGKPINTK